MLENVGNAVLSTLTEPIKQAVDSAQALIPGSIPTSAPTVAQPAYQMPQPLPYAMPQGYPYGMPQAYPYPPMGYPYAMPYAQQAMPYLPNAMNMPIPVFSPATPTG